VGTLTPRCGQQYILLSSHGVSEAFFRMDLAGIRQS
jgi:hypothetical protein